MTDTPPHVKVVPFPPVGETKPDPDYYGKNDGVSAIACGRCQGQYYKIRSYNGHPYVIECADCEMPVGLEHIELKQWT